MMPPKEEPKETAARQENEEFWIDLPAPLPGMIAGMHPSKTDPQGSWTGLPAPDAAEQPVQDADDL